jgi:tetratricopeptide (TPR) repeat protein
MAKNGLAMIWHEQGRSKEAEELLTKVLKALESLLGLRHPSTLTCMSNLAVTLKVQGLHNQAEELLVKVVDTSLELSGMEYSDTLKFMNNLATTKQAAGQWLDLEKTQLQIFETSKILGDDHPYHLQYSMNLARTYTELGQHDKAEMLSLQTL